MTTKTSKWAPQTLRDTSPQNLSTTSLYDFTESIATPLEMELIFSSFSTTCPDTLSNVWDCHSSFSCNTYERVCALFFILFMIVWKMSTTAWLWTDQWVCTLGELFYISPVTKKEIHWVHPFDHHLTDLLSVSIQKLKNHYSFVGSCLVSTVFSSRSVNTEESNYQS